MGCFVVFFALIRRSRLRLERRLYDKIVLHNGVISRGQVAKNDVCNLPVTQGGGRVQKMSSAIALPSQHAPVHNTSSHYSLFCTWVQV